MYYIDFLKNLLKKSNTGLFIYILVNAFLLVMIFAQSSEGRAGVFAGIGLYLVSLVIAISPLGEWMLRISTGCRKIKDESDLRRLEHILLEVYDRARRLEPTVPKDVHFFIQESEQPNAFAVGRKTICVTRGLLRYSDNYIKAVVAHEFGHLAHKDTAILLVVTVGNIIFNSFVLVVRMFLQMIRIFTMVGTVVGPSSDGRKGFGIALLLTIGTERMLDLMLAGWTIFGMWLVNISGRENEYLADSFAADCGYGDDLQTFLRHLPEARDRGDKNRMMHAIMDTHPATSKRIERLEARA